MSDQWYYFANGRKLGPVSLGSLKKLVDEGVVRSDSEIFREGMRDWVAAREVPELFGAVASSSDAYTPESHSRSYEPEPADYGRRPMRRKAASSTKLNYLPWAIGGGIALFLLVCITCGGGMILAKKERDNDEKNAIAEQKRHQERMDAINDEHRKRMNEIDRKHNERQKQIEEQAKKEDAERKKVAERNAKEWQEQGERNKKANEALALRQAEQQKAAAERYEQDLKNQRELAKKNAKVRLAEESLKKQSYEAILKVMGNPIETYTSTRKANVFMHTWKREGGYTVVLFARTLDGQSTFVLEAVVDRPESALARMKKVLDDF